MFDFEEIITRLILKLELKNKAELASVFNISTQVLTNWKSRNKIPFEEIIILCKSKNMMSELDYILYGHDYKCGVPSNIAILVNRALELNPNGLQDDLIRFVILNSVAQKLRTYDKSINFAKYMFWDRYDTVASYRLMKFLLKKIQKDVDLENVTMENSKQILKKALEEYNLGIISFLKDALQKKDREHTIKLIESLDDWDAYCILKDINLAIDAFEDAITWLAFKLPLLKLKNEI